MNKMEMYKKVIKNESDILKKANISDLGHFVFETQDEMDDFLTSDYVRLGIIGNLNGTLKQIYSEIIPAETKADTLKSCNITVDEYVCTYYIELNNHSEKVHVMAGTDFST